MHCTSLLIRDICSSSLHRGEKGLMVDCMDDNVEHFGIY